MSAAPAILNTAEITAKFSESLRTLAKLQGFSEQTVTLAEVGVVLKSCAYRTKVAKPDATVARTRGRVLRSAGLTSGKLTITINTGSRGAAGRVWALVGDGPKKGASAKANRRSFLVAGQMSDDAQTFTPSKYHFKNSRWWDVKFSTDEYSEKFRQALPAAKQSAGLARQSWVQISDDLGLILEDIPGGDPLSGAAIAKARQAIASNGRTYANGIGTSEYQEHKSYVATLKNSLPYNIALGLDRVLVGVLAGRAKFFEENVKRGVFASHTATVKAYPWLKLVGAG